MLVRDFIDDSLYNPHYGFYTSNDPIRSSRYSNTELFKPWYASAIAKYMVSEYKLKLYPHKDLIIYEIGGRHGRLMTHILDYIERYEPSVYQRTQYRMIELSDRQKQHHGIVQVLDQNIFDWNTLVTDQCFFLGVKVINHFAHDVIRYDENQVPYQGLVCMDNKHSLTEIFEPAQDATIERYLSLQKKLGSKYNKQNWYSRWFRQCHSIEFIPTRLLELMDILNTWFPGHRLILTDYASLSNTIGGMNAPLVQTDYHGSILPSNTYLLSPGWYPIFPTNFEQLRDMYLLICVKSMQYSDFLERYGEPENQRLYQPNVKVLLT
ncbi:S-adenosyl-L-methionine-dependent methyltransferase [Gilbertella persicaria]|uniref:S-adenosyl-L-methionine-dependent methyltransferase n=1 Tax=Gilbertella persicaria TaxID=101096 RepID=UPI00221EFB87|nr:S-adenosyl-L-methionine-dependent methyltransferase [Gilbertella persicaria]KAI8063687.1 S-adenosyl-L-methionine-dependent methyltransferase [Gilbertella persicaria]